MFKKISLGGGALLLVGAIVGYFKYVDFESSRLNMLTSNSEVVATEAGTIEYRIEGESGPVILFLHGSPGGYDQAPSIPGARVLTPSRPGYLRTPLSVGQTPAQQARAFAELLNVLDIEAVVVMGASGGGPAAISFAAMYPHSTLGLIAMEAVSQPMTDPAEVPVLMRSDFMIWVTLSLTHYFLGADGIVGLMVPDVANRQRIVSDPSKLSSLETMIWSIWPTSLRAAGQQNDMRQFGTLNLPAAEVSVPTLIVHGTADVNVPFAQSEVLAQQINGAELYVVEGADHMMPFSHSDEVDAEVERFIETLSLR